MSDTQPLLVASTKQSGDDGDDYDDLSNKRQFSRAFSDWRRCFGNKNSDSGHEKLSDNTEHDPKESHIGFLGLFRFADRTDLFMIFIGACFIVSSAVFYVAKQILFTRVVGSFAIYFSGEICYHQQQNLFIAKTTNNGCPLGIDINLFNYAKLQKVCNHNVTLSSAALITSKTLLRVDVMNKVHWLLIIGLVEFFCNSIVYFVFTLAAKRQTSRINVLLLRALLQRSISYFDTKPSGQFSAKLFENIDNINKGIGFELSRIFEVICGTTLSLIVVFYLNWKLTLIMMCILPFVIGGSLVFVKLITTETIREFDSYSKAGQIAREVFSSLRTVLSLNGSKFEQRRYGKQLQAAQWSSVRKGAVFGIFIGRISLMTNIFYAVGFFFGSLLIYYEGQTKLNISDIITIVILFAQNIATFGMIAPFLQSLAEAQGAAVPVFRLIDETDDADRSEMQMWKESESDMKSIDINGDIQFDNVNFIYPAREGVPVLHNLTLVARVGETTALVGASGCGKSTCVSLLLRYYEPSSGRITINGRSISEYNVEQLRQNIGIVSQEPVLFDTTIYENIRFGKKNATRSEIEEAAREANVHHFIMQLPKQYDTRIGEQGLQLSGGEKQRIALARALVKQSAILLLDEATSALDKTNEKIVQKALDQACKNRTTIVIAHRLSTIQNAHRIYVLDKGCVIEEGTHETLMIKEGSIYHGLVKAQHIEQMEDDGDEIMNETLVGDEDRTSEHSRQLGSSQIDVADEVRVRKETQWASFA